MAPTPPLDVRCRCGTVHGELLDPCRGSRTICYCDDCQAFAVRLGRPDILDAYGGTDLLQVTPRQLRIAAGDDQIACLRLTAKGLFRWYARCCRTPIGNTAPLSWVPFVGVPTAFVPAAAASSEVPKRVEFRVQQRFARGTPPAGDGEAIAGKGSGAYLCRNLKLIGLGTLRRAHRPSPFFRQDGTPVVGLPVPVQNTPL